MTYVKPRDLYDVTFSQMSQSLHCMTSWTPNRLRRVCTFTTWRSAESTGMCGVVFITMIIINDPVTKSIDIVEITICYDSYFEQALMGNMRIIFIWWMFLKI